MEKKRYIEIDALRGWAIFLVVLGHSVIYFPIDLHNTFWGNSIYKMCISVHIPLFFIISGYCYRYEGLTKNYIQKKIGHILIPYISFGLIDTFFRSVMSSFVNRSRTIQDSIINMFLYGGEYWFLYVLFFIYILFPLILRIHRGKKINVGFCILLMLLSACEIKVKLFQLGGICEYLFWFGLGYYIQRYSVKNIMLVIKKIRYIVFLPLSFAWILLALDNNYSFYGKNILVAFIGCIVSIILVSFNNFKNIFAKFGKSSLQIYLLNGFALVGSRYFVCNILRCTNMLLIISFNLLVDFFIVYILISRFLNRFVWFKLITGMYKY